MSDDNVIHLPARPRVVKEPPAKTPRSEFGLRKQWLRSDNLADLTPRKPLSAFAELARAYGDSKKEINRSEKRIDPELRQELITEAQHIAKMADALRERCVAYEMYPLAYSLNEASSGLELACALATINEEELK